MARAVVGADPGERRHVTLHSRPGLDAFPQPRLQHHDGALPSFALDVEGQATDVHALEAE
jgi:hypothetical protein